MNSRFWLSLISKYLFGLSWLNFVALNIYGAWNWWDIKASHMRHPGLYGEWQGFLEFLKIGFFSTLIFSGLMIISGLIQLALDAHARSSTKQVR